MSGWYGEVYTRSVFGVEVVQRTFTARWLWLAHVKRKIHALGVDWRTMHEPEIGVFWRMRPVPKADAMLSAREAKR